MLSLPFPGWVGWILLAALALLSANPAAQATPLTPDDVVQAALSAPEVQEADAAVATARALRGQSTLLLHNPQLNASLVAGDRLELDVLQPLSLGGEGLATHRLAARSLESAEATALRTRLEVAAGARLAYADAVVAGRQLAIAASGAQLAERLTAAVQRKHEEGEAALLDLRLARMAEAQAAARLLDARTAQTEALRALSAVTGLVIEGDALLDDPLASAPLVSGGEVAERSDVLAARSALAAAEAERTRQRALSLPVVGVGLALDQDSTETVYGPAVSLSLPLFDRNQSGRAAAKGGVRAASAQLARTESVADTERRTAEVRHQEAEALQGGLGDDLVAEGEAALESVSRGYAAGQLDLIATVLLQAEILEGQTAAISLIGRVAAARIDLMLSTEDNTLLPGGGQ